MNDPEEKLKALHLAFCEATNNDPNVLRYHLFQRVWADFERNGFTQDDLRLVLCLVIRQNRNYSMKRKLTIRGVVEDMPRFCEDLAEARRCESRKATPKEKVLGELRGFIPARNGNALKTVGEVIKKAGLVP